MTEFGPELVNDSLLVGGPPVHGHGRLHVRSSDDDVIGTEEAIVYEIGQEALVDLEDDFLNSALPLGKVRCTKIEFDISVGGEVLDLLLVEVCDGLIDVLVRPDNLPAQVSVVLSRGAIPRLMLPENGEVVGGVGLGQANPADYGGQAGQDQGPGVPLGAQVDKVVLLLVGEEEVELIVLWVGGDVARAIEDLLNILM